MTLHSKLRFLRQHQGVARILAFGDRRESQSLGNHGRQVFQRMNRQVDAAVEQRVFQLFSKDAFSANQSKADQSLHRPSS